MKEIPREEEPYEPLAHIRRTDFQCTWVFLGNPSHHFLRLVSNVSTKFLGYLNEFSQPLTYDIYENSMENILVDVTAERLTVPFCFIRTNISTVYLTCIKLLFLFLFRKVALLGPVQHQSSVRREKVNRLVKDRNPRGENRV